MNNDRATFIRYIVTKVAEEDGNDPEAWKVIDEHNINSIQNLTCTKDQGLFAC